MDKKKLAYYLSCQKLDFVKFFQKIVTKSAMWHPAGKKGWIPDSAVFQEYQQVDMKNWLLV